MEREWEIESIKDCMIDSETGIVSYKVQWKQQWLNKNEKKLWQNDIEKITAIKVKQRQSYYLATFKCQWLQQSELQNCQTFIAAYALISLKNKNKT